MWNIHDPDAFLDRLTRTQFSRPHVFLFGSALTSPFPDGCPGVLGVDGVVALIKAHYRRNYPSALRKFEQILSAAKNQYQAAFEQLSGRGSAADANSIIQQAVLSAYTGLVQRPHSNASCMAAESDVSGWHISPWLESIGKLLAAPPPHIANTVLTTNFDPLIQIAIEKAGGRSRTSVLARDGNLSQNVGTGCHVIHLHGHWTAADTLHTQVQLRQERPHLREFLQRLLERFAIVVVGYSGWDDIFTKAIADVIESCEGTPELLWAFYETNTEQIVEKNSELLARLRPGYARNHVTLYHSINLREHLVALYDRFHPRAQAAAADEHSREQAVFRLGETPTVELISASATSVISRADIESRTTATTAVQPLHSIGEGVPTHGTSPAPLGAPDGYMKISISHDAASTENSLVLATTFGASPNSAPDCFKILFDSYVADSEPYYICRSLDQELAQVIEARSIWLYGESGTGKTCAIQRLIIQSKVRSLYITLSASCTGKAKDSIVHLCEQIADALGNSTKIPSNSRKAIDVTRRMLRDTEGEIWIYIDEIPLSEPTQISIFTNGIVSLLGGVALPSSDLRILISSIYGPKEHIDVSRQRIYERMTIAHSGIWIDSEIEKLTHLVVSQLSLKLTSSEITEVVSVAKGIPRFIKQFFRNNIAFPNLKFSDLLRRTNSEFASYQR